jgi:hypothetical protein
MSKKPQCQSGIQELVQVGSDRTWQTDCGAPEEHNGRNASTQSEAEKRRHPVLMQPGVREADQDYRGVEGTGTMNLQVNWSLRRWITAKEGDLEGL